ncbi:MAG: DUF4258 domain-containing protein [Oscillospiraceae bacterium]|nr:DUF4258 domain-containing protein [Oscillospiraceae bacterium]
MQELNIEALRNICRGDNIKWTLHALKRLRKRKISSEAVVNAVLAGEIIEQYPNDKPFPSCLIFNKDYKNPLHVVISTDDKSVYLITEYHPTLSEWESDYKTRKE